MYARIVMAETKPDKHKEVLNALNTVVLADLQMESGFQGMYVLKQEDSGKLVAFSLFETAEAAQASGVGFAQRRLPQMMSLLTEKPFTDVYEVIYQP